MPFRRAVSKSCRVRLTRRTPSGGGIAIDVVSNDVDELGAIPHRTDFLNSELFLKNRLEMVLEISDQTRWV